MTSLVLADNAYGTLASGLTASDTTLSFTAGHGARFPTVPAGSQLYCCILNSNNVLEEIIVTLHTAGSDTATISRAAGSTSAKAWNAGDRIEARLSSAACAFFAQLGGGNMTGAWNDARVTVPTSASPDIWSTATGGAVINMTGTGTVFSFPTAPQAGARRRIIAGGPITFSTASGLDVQGNVSFAAVANDIIDVDAITTSSFKCTIHKDDGTPVVGTTVSAATQAEQETASSTTAYTSPGTQKYHPGMIKSWSQWSVSGGTPTMNVQYNCSSITDNGVGDFTHNCTVGFSTAQFGFVGAVGRGSGGAAAMTMEIPYLDDPTGTTIRGLSVNAAYNPVDSKYYSIMLVGDQA
jgi:hypothetical protein